MTQPTTGIPWNEGGFDNIDNRFYSRGGLAAALIRDNNGLATSIAPYAAGNPPTLNWTPFAQDGQLRADLFAMVRSNGQWVLNPNANQGFYLIGAFEDKGGPERSPNVKHDDAMVLQSIFPFDSDLTAAGMTIQFNGVEVLKPLLRRLRMNLPLSDPNGNPIVELPGLAGVTSRPVDNFTPDYQLILLFNRQRDGGDILTAEGYPLVRLDDVSKYKRDKTSSDSPNLGFTVLPDPYHMDIDPTNPASQVLVPALYSEWIGGNGWTAVGGAPVWIGQPPLATAGSTGAATLVVTQPVGGGASLTYVVQKQTNDTGAWSTVAPASTTTASGNVTFTFASLTAGKVRFQVKATGTNGSSSMSRYSNDVIIT